MAYHITSNSAFMLNTAVPGDLDLIGLASVRFEQGLEHFTRRHACVPTRKSRDGASIDSSRIDSLQLSYRIAPWPTTSHNSCTNSR